MSEDPRTPFSGLRPWVPTRDHGARERARALLATHMESASTTPAEPARRRRSHRHWVASLAAAVVIAGAGAAVAAILLRTQHTGHLPVFTAQGALSPQFQIGGRGSGYCWTASLATGAADAYRCMQGNAIHDPCFAPSAHARTVACFIDPWHRVTLLRLTRPLPRHGPVLSSLPWAIVTTDGRHCTYLTGATALLGGERINYGCVGGSYLLGVPNTRNPLWTIRSTGAHDLELPGHERPIGDYPLVGIRETVP